nr:MAG TPA: conotoxin [Caudoviricetes sp.]
MRCLPPFLILSFTPIPSRGFRLNFQRLVRAFIYNTLINFSKILF